LLRSKAEVKVLGIVLFFDDLHLREIARRAGVSPYETRRELGTLVEIGVLSCEKRGNQVSFRVRKDCPFLEELKGLYQKTEGVFSELREYLADVSGITYAFVFGSAAEGRERPTSDIDLLIIGDAEDKIISERIFSVQRKTGKEINFIVWSTADFLDKIAENSGFLKNIAAKKRVWLLGEEDGFVRALKERPGKKGRTGQSESKGVAGRRGKGHEGGFR